MGHTSRMNVVLDGRPLSIDRSTVADGLRAAVAAAQSQGRIIIEAKADGVALTDEMLTNPSEEPATIAELRLVSADPRTLVRVTLLDAVEALETARAEQAVASELVQAGKLEDAFPHLQVALTTWQAVRDVISRSAQVLGLNLETLVLPGLEEAESFGAAGRELADALTGVRSALQTEDWSALTDVVGYDLDAQVGVWKRLLASLADHVLTMTQTGAGAAQPPGPRAV